MRQDILQRRKKLNTEKLVRKEDHCNNLSTDKSELV